MALFAAASAALKLSFAFRDLVKFLSAGSSDEWAGPVMRESRLLRFVEFRVPASAASAASQCIKQSGVTSSFAQAASTHLSKCCCRALLSVLAVLDGADAGREAPADAGRDGVVVCEFMAVRSWLGLISVADVRDASEDSSTDCCERKKEPGESDSRDEYLCGLPLAPLKPLVFRRSGR